MTQNELDFRLREVGGNQHSWQLPFFYHDLLVTGAQIICRGAKELQSNRVGGKKKNPLKIEKTKYIDNLT